jgi:hypothetical protein
LNYEPAKEMHMVTIAENNVKDFTVFSFRIKNASMPVISGTKISKCGMVIYSPSIKIYLY